MRSLYIQLIFKDTMETIICGLYAMSEDRKNCFEKENHIYMPKFLQHLSRAKRGNSKFRIRRLLLLRDSDRRLTCLLRRYQWRCLPFSKMQYLDCQHANSSEETSSVCFIESGFAYIVYSKKASFVFSSTCGGVVCISNPICPQSLADLVKYLSEQGQGAKNFESWRRRINPWRSPVRIWHSSSVLEALVCGLAPQCVAGGRFSEDRGRNTS